MSKPKEPHHFRCRPRDPFTDRGAAGVPEAVRGGGRRPARGEGSVLYMYSRSAPAEILGLSPAARVVIMLRDPLEMVPSLHAHNLLLNYEDLNGPGPGARGAGGQRAGRRSPPPAFRRSRCSMSTWPLLRAGPPLPGGLRPGPGAVHPPRRPAEGAGEDLRRGPRLPGAAAVSARPS